MCNGTLFTVENDSNEMCDMVTIPSNGLNETILELTLNELSTSSIVFNFGVLKWKPIAYLSFLKIIVH